MQVQGMPGLGMRGMQPRAMFRGGFGGGFRGRWGFRGRGFNRGGFNRGGMPPFGFRGRGFPGQMRGGPQMFGAVPGFRGGFRGRAGYGGLPPQNFQNPPMQG